MGCGVAARPFESAVSGHDSPLEAAGIAEASSFVVGQGHAGRLSACARDPVSGVLATGGSDGSVRLWRDRDQPLASFRAHGGRVEALALDSRQQVLASAGGDGTVAVWQLSSGLGLGRAGAVLAEFPPPTNMPGEGAVSSWNLAFQGSRLWLTQTEILSTDHPTQQRRVGQLKPDGFVFSSRQELRRSHRRAVAPAQGFFTCSLPEAEWEHFEDASGPWGQALVSSEGRWLAASRLRSSAAGEALQTWLLFPLAGAEQPLGLGPYAARLEQVVDTDAGPLAVLRTNLQNHRFSTWSIMSLGPTKELISVETRAGRGALAAGRANVFFATRDGTLEALDFEGKRSSLKLPRLHDVRSVVVTENEELLAVATSDAVEVWSLERGAQLRKFTGQGLWHLSELAFGGGASWLLVSNGAPPLALDLNAPHTSFGAAFKVGAVAEHFSADQGMPLSSVTATGALLARRGETLLLLSRTKDGVRQETAIARSPPGDALLAVSGDGRYLVEAFPTGDVMLLDVEDGTGRRLANPVGKPRRLMGLPRGNFALFGAQGLALLRGDDARLLYLESVSGQTDGKLDAFAFAPFDRSYAGGGSALQQVRQRRAGAQLGAALEVPGAPSRTVSELIADFLNARD